MNSSEIVYKDMGIMPVLLRIGSFALSTYSVFIILAIATGLVVYYKESKKAGKANEFSFLIVVGALAGSSMGAKLLEMLIHMDAFTSKNGFISFIFSGRTILGGFIGGTLGVWFTKRMLGIKERRGNLFAPAIAIGVAIGRLGCFFNGCCYGKSTGLPWGVDFGDQVFRHPTQLYESLFMLLMFVFLKLGFKKQLAPPGFLFKLLMVAYFLFRFFIEFLRTERFAFWGLTYYQIISVFVLLYLLLSEKGIIIKQMILYGKSTIKLSA